MIRQSHTPSTASATQHSRPSLTFDLVKGAAIGRWPAIAQNVFGISSDYLTGDHGPCPKCKGDDRFRVFEDFAQTGGAICNQCGRDLGDGFKLGDWFTGWPKAETLKRVADYLGISSNGSYALGSKGETVDPAKDLKFEAWNDLLIGTWCIRKPPITPKALRHCHARLARYRNEYTVIALPVWGEQLTATDPVGWSLYRADGGKLPKRKLDKATGRWKMIGQVKVKLTYGSQPGLIGPVDELATATHIWKLEGPSDLLAFYSLQDIATSHVAITNANGAGEKPPHWALKLFTDKTVYTLHDADQPGERGACGWRDDKGKWHTGWATEAARYARESRQLALPYSIEKEHGKDLRDFLNGVCQ